MIALPSIAFGGFSGSSKGVTARYQDGRSILSLKSHPTGEASALQLAHRANFSKITKSYQLLSDAQMKDWENLAEHASGQSVFGKKAKLTGANLYLRLNSNRVMAGESMLSDAPQQLEYVPEVEYKKIFMTPAMIAFQGIEHQSEPYKLVVKMSVPQSPGITNGWSKTVIISTNVEDDWGEADVTEFYLNTLGVSPIPGQKVFIECYWMDTSNGFVGQTYKDSALCEASPSGYVPRKRVTMDKLEPESEQHVSDIDVDFSTAAPVIQFDAKCLGHSNVASSYAYLEEQLPDELCGTSMALGRSNSESGKINAQSYIIWLHNSSWDPSYICFAHRGGYYERETEVFGPGILY